MMFAVINDLPYLVHNGMAYPVSIKDNGDYELSESQAFKTDETGRYMLFEVMAKCKNRCSIKRQQKRKLSKESPAWRMLILNSIQPHIMETSCRNLTSPEFQSAQATFLT